MPLGYQQRDHEIVDYEEYRVTSTLWARGPAPRSWSSGQYFAAIGAAQTFGCFCETPYPALLQQQTGIDALNLGSAGAGPRFFLNEPRLLQLINNARFVIVQVMSGRSEDNSVFRSGGREWLHRRADEHGLSAEIAYKELLEQHDEDFVRRIVAETRSNWVSSFTSLLRAIAPPKILFWFSQRSPEYEERFDRVHGLFGEFPQLVNAAMVEAIRPHADAYVECVSRRGMPQLLTSRFTGLPAIVDYTRKGEEQYADSYNTYYPSPEMHVDAADALHDMCLRVSHADWAFKPGTSHIDTGRVALDTTQTLEPLRQSLFGRLTDVERVAFVGDRETVAFLRECYDATSASHQYVCFDDSSAEDWTRIADEQRRIVVCSIKHEEPLTRRVRHTAAERGLTAPVLRLFADVFVNVSCGDDPLHDAEEPGIPSHLRYAIVGTPRSGSEFLCKTLTSTAVAGYPEEHLRLESQVLTRYCGFDCTRYVRMLQARRTTPNGVFGTKIISHFLHEHVNRSRGLKQVLKQFRFIHVVRRDRVAQAISAVLASKTGIWHVANDREQRHYERLLADVTITDSDLQWIRWLSDGFDRENRQLAEFIARNNVPALSVFYEDLVADPAVHLRSILSFLNLNATVSGISVSLKPTRSGLSDSIRAMYQKSQYANRRPGLRSLIRAVRLWRLQRPVPVGTSASPGHDARR